MGSPSDTIGTGTGFATTCQVAIRNSYDTSGSASRARITALSPTQIRAIWKGTSRQGVESIEGWNENGALLAHRIEMAATGIRRSSLYEWLMSSNKPGMSRLINIQRIARGGSMIAPFILGLQKSLWNADHWALVANVAGNAYAGGNLTPTSSNRVITVESSFGGTMDLHPGYFLPGKNIHVFARSPGSVLTITQFKIVQAATNEAGNQIDVEVVLNQPEWTSSPATGEASSAIKSNPTATAGVVFCGINNVHDVEQWCRNMVNVNTNKLVPFWYQTRRKARRVDEEYRKFYDHMMEHNEWYRLFADLPLAERNAQDEIRDQKEWMNAYFFGERISAKQTLDKWGELEQILSVSGASVDPGTGGTVMGYRANMIGVLPQLADCGRLTDCLGTDFPINTFLENDIWDVVRARRSQGRKADEIDIYTDEGTADEFMQAFIAYSKAKTGDIARINIEQGVSEWGFPFRRFRLYKPIGVSVTLLTDDYFNDMATAAGYSTSGAAPHGAGVAGLGKFMMILDQGSGGTIYPGIIQSNRKAHTVGDINDLSRIDQTFSCVMENPKSQVTLTSETTTAVVEAPANSLVVANFGSVISGV